MAIGYEIDKARVDRYMPNVRAILGQLCLVDAPVMPDELEATDLRCCTMSDLRFAVRVRVAKPEYYPRYAHQFTIRYSRRDNKESEFFKILDGWGDLFFYGWGDPDSDELLQWWLLDLKKFRSWIARAHIRAVTAGATIYPWDIKENADLSSRFMVFNLNQVPAILMRSSWKSTQQRQKAI